ncbi:MAG: hypothetical protein WAM89_07530 [Terriglobales bacterium]
MASVTIRYEIANCKTRLVRTGWLAISALALLFSVSTLRAQVHSVLPLPPATVSTVPSNGDVNPYGVAIVPYGVAAGLTLQPDDILVSNFNDNLNLQGIGTTVVRVNSNGQQSLFYQSSYPTTGMTAALGVVQKGFVFVGNLPTLDGTSATVQPGSLTIIDGNGHLAGSIVNSSLINGPWGLAVADNGASAHIFVSNVLSGTITRVDVSFPVAGGVAIVKAVVIGSGFNHRPDPAALELGPSGLRFDSVHDILYVASSMDNAVYALSGAAKANSSLGSGQLVFQDFVHLHGPTQLAGAPNGDLLVANSDGSNVDPNQPSEIVEFTTAGEFISQSSVDPNNGGAFGVAARSLGSEAVRIAAVDDNANTVTTWTKIVY